MYVVKIKMITVFLAFKYAAGKYFSEEYLPDTVCPF